MEAVKFKWYHQAAIHLVSCQVAHTYSDSFGLVCIMKVELNCCSAELLAIIRNCVGKIRPALGWHQSTYQHAIYALSSCRAKRRCLRQLSNSIVDDGSIPHSFLSPPDMSCPQLCQNTPLRLGESERRRSFSLEYMFYYIVKW